MDKKYETLLLDIISAFESKTFTNPERLLFTPCRMLLEESFKKVNDVNCKVLPNPIVYSESNNVLLANCSRYLNGLREDDHGNRKKVRPFIDEYISQQIQTIIGICHPASHEIQLRYTQYTFKSVLWALFDVLIWLKSFVDQNK